MSLDDHFGLNEHFGLDEYFGLYEHFQDGWYNLQLGPFKAIIWPSCH